MLCNATIENNVLGRENSWYMHNDSQVVISVFEGFLNGHTQTLEIYKSKFLKKNKKLVTGFSLL